MSVSSSKRWEAIPKPTGSTKRCGKPTKKREKTAQHDGHPEVCDGRTPILPDGGTGTLTEHTSASSLVGAVGNESSGVDGREARLEHATPTTPNRGLVDRSTTPQPRCQATHPQNPAVKIMQLEVNQQQGNNNDRIIIKLAKIVMGAVVRWKRSKKQEAREAKEEGDTGQEESIKYLSRLLHCTRCNEPQEAWWMRLRQKTGYRDIHCPGCEKHERCSHNRCQCEIIWRQCETHRIDPKTHASRKAPEKKEGTKGKIEINFSSNRSAPECEGEQRLEKRKSQLVHPNKDS